MIPASVRPLYPFRSRQLSLPHLPDPTSELHYIDEGEGDEVILCLHGNPTWSFYYRNLVKALRGRYRVIALDHLGCGGSSKPANFPYRLADHIANLEYFIEKLGLTKVTLVLHDWGGPIGLGWATRHPEAVQRLVLLNTAAFRSLDIPKRIALCKTPILGEYLMRKLNAFARAAVTMATTKGLSPAVKQAFLWPYDSYANRIAIARFVQDIPLSPRHPSYETLAQIEEKLAAITCPKLILWGLRDFCFHRSFLAQWQRIYPDAQVETYAAAGHYLLEDAGDDVNAAIGDFLERAAAQ